MKTIIRIYQNRLGLLSMILLCTALWMSSCKEHIDMSDRFTFLEETVWSYLEKNDSLYSEYISLLKTVPISSISTSTVAQLLSARGHYTCFAPSNKAIQEYLDSLYRKGLITEPSWDGFATERAKDSIQKVIVYNSIIDGGDVIYYDIANFPTRNNDEFSVSNMNDRRLSVVRDSLNPDIILINGEYPISLKNRDIEAINGYVHEMETVIAPSNETITDILRTWINEGGSSYTVMARLVLACGLGDTLSKVRDEVFEQMMLKGEIEDIGDFKTNKESGLPSDHRNYGFTIFAEPDQVWEATLGKSAAEITVDDIKNYVVEHGLYPNAKNDDNYESTDNVLNQFVTYHILPEYLSRDKLVIHYNEKGYNYATSRNYTVATEEFYTTMGKRRLLKVYESFESNGIYLNRFPVLRNGRGKFSSEHLNINDYHESGEFKALRGSYLHADENLGICVEDNIGDAAVASVLNGIIYPIGKVLAYTENVATQLKNQRLRFEVASMLPELMNNQLRRPMSNYPTRSGAYRGFPTNYQFFNGMELKEGTRFYYLTGLGSNWMNWQGDEFNIKGKYEFTMELPPVPMAGHYELRLAVQSNSNLRGMCQVYWGSDKNNLPAAGIPFDMRMGGTQRHLTNENQPSIVGWVSDAELGDEEAIIECDKTMRNNGFMKAPEHYSPTPGSTSTARQNADVNRRIIVSADMDPDKTYYIKFKSVLDDVEKEHILDYMEYCAKEVYDNPEESEDIW